MLTIGVLASGRGSNLQSIIDSKQVGELPVEIAVVISDKSQARALSRARHHGIKAVHIDPGACTDREFEDKMLEYLHEYGVELVVMAGFMRLLSPYFIGNYRHRIMNIHPSLLPAFKGLNAQKQALDYGVRYSGCTVHFADEGMDSGPIILQAVVPVKQTDTEESLSQRILKEEHRLYPRAIKLFAGGKLEVEQGKVFIKD